MTATAIDALRDRRAGGPQRGLAAPSLGKKAAERVDAPTSRAAVEILCEPPLDAAAPVRQPLEPDARDHADVPTPPGYIAMIEQSVANPAVR